jgi:4-amino-4-deoxy-L-arabinose transferase-like glycosyltransferase
MENMKKENIQYSLYFILFLSLALRLWGIWNVSTTDEYNEVLEALRVCSGHFNFERWIKRFYLYILSIEYGIFYAMGWVFNAFNSPMDFAEKIVRNMEPLFVLGRITSAVSGACTVGLLYKIGNDFFDRRVAIISSVLLTLSVFHIDLSQQAKVDALLGLLVVATICFIFKIIEADNKKKWAYGWCGFLMALSIQTKINSVVLFVPFAVAILSDYKSFRTRLNYIIFYFIPFFICGFILANPPVLLAPHKFITSILSLGNVYTTPVNVVPNDLVGFLAYPLYYFRSMGAVISILTILAFANAFYKLNIKRLVLLSFIVSFYILMGASKNLVAAYYMIPVVPAIYLLIGDFLSESTAKLSSTIPLLQGRSSFVLILIVTIGLINPAVNVAHHEFSLAGKNTRYLAKDWIESNIPAGSKISMDSGKSINSFAPPIAENRENLTRIIRNTKQNISEGKIVHAMVDRNALIYYELLLKTIPEKVYDITSTMFGLDVKSIDYYIQNNFEYFIISKDMKKNRTGEYILKSAPKVASFYLSLDSDPRVKLIKTIAPSVRNRGDTFYIYKLMCTGST